MVKFINNMTEFNALLADSGDKLIVVDFTATWCGPCRMIAPHFERLAAENTDAVFVKVDVDEADDIAAELGIQSMPTFKFFKSGQKIDEFSGANVGTLTAKVVKHK